MEKVPKWNGGIAMKKRWKRLLSLCLSASLCLGMVQFSALAEEGSPTVELRETEELSTYVYGNGEDSKPLILDQVYVSMKSPVDKEEKQAWHSVGMVALKIEGFGKTEEELRGELRGQKDGKNGVVLSEAQGEAIKEQVLAQLDSLTGPATEEILGRVKWTELKYEQNDENKNNICPWHLDGEIEFYPTAFFLRKDKTIPGGPQPEAQYYPSHTHEWNALTWGLLKDFAEPQKDGYQVIIDDLETREEIEAVKQVFAAVEETIVVGPDLRNDKTCPLRKTIMDNYHVKATDLDNGVVDVIWYVSKRGENCSSPCVYHVDGVVYNTLTHGVIDPEELRGSLEVIHRYYEEENGERILQGEVNEGIVEVQANQTIEIGDLEKSNYQGTEYPHVSTTVNDVAVEEVIVGPEETVTVVLTYVLSKSGPTSTTTPESPPPSPSETTSPDVSESPDVTTSPDIPTSPPPTASDGDEGEKPEPPDDDDEDDRPSPPPTVVEPTPVPSREPEEPTPPPVEEPTPPVEDLEDPDVPLTGGPDALPPDPDEDLLLEDPDVPLAQVPATGDDLKLWLLAMLSAALGLGWLSRGKRREEM